MAKRSQLHRADVVPWLLSDPSRTAADALARWAPDLTGRDREKALIRVRTWLFRARAAARNDAPAPSPSSALPELGPDQPRGPFLRALDGWIEADLTAYRSAGALSAVAALDRRRVDTRKRLSALYEPEQDARDPAALLARYDAHGNRIRVLAETWRASEVARAARGEAVHPPPEPEPNRAASDERAALTELLRDLRQARETRQAGAGAALYARVLAARDRLDAAGEGEAVPLALHGRRPGEVAAAIVARAERIRELLGR